MAGEDATIGLRDAPLAERIARKSFGLGRSDRFEVEAERNEQRLRGWLEGRGPPGRLSASRAPDALRRSSTKAPPAPSTDASPAPAAGIRKILFKRLKLEFRGLKGGSIRRKPIGGEPSLIARAKGGVVAVGSAIEKSAGRPLPAPVRALLEPAFGESFDDVRIHTDAHASMAAAAVRAEAFTLGRDIYFNKGYYDPGSSRGIALLGHELTHVVQGRGAAKTVRRAPQGGEGFGALTVADEPSTDAAKRHREAAARQLASDIRAAISEYARARGKVTWTDDQYYKRSFMSHAFWGDFNAAEADAKTGYGGGAKANNDLAMWVYMASRRIKKDRTIPKLKQRDLVYESLILNRGNVPRALGSIATVLHDSRSLADAVDGLGDDQRKDYYRFVGAWTGTLNWGGRAMWSAFKTGDIAVTQVLAPGNYRQASDMKRIEWEVGYEAARLIRRKALDVAGFDAYEGEAVANERLIQRSLSRGEPLTGLQASFAPGGAAASKIRRAGLDPVDKILAHGGTKVAGTGEAERLYVSDVGGLSHTVEYAPGIRLRGNEQFLAKAQEQLDALARTKVGRRLLEYIARGYTEAGTKITIADRLVARYKRSDGTFFDAIDAGPFYRAGQGGRYLESGAQAIEGDRVFTVGTGGAATTEIVYTKVTSFRPGYGFSGTVFYDPWLTIHVPGEAEFDPVVTLFHELGHAAGGQYGQFVRRPGYKFKTATGEITDLEEARNVGLGWEAGLPTENALRQELGLAPRTRYAPEGQLLFTVDPNAPQAALRAQTDRAKVNELMHNRLPREVDPAVPRGPVAPPEGGGGFFERIMTRVKGFVDEIFAKLEGLGGLVREWSREKVKSLPWLEEVLFGTEFGLFGKILPGVKDLFTGLVTAVRATETGSAILNVVGRTGRFLLTCFKGLTRFLGKIAGPLAALALFVDADAWFRGPSSLLDAPGISHATHDKLVANDDRAWGVTNLYYGPLVFLDLVTAVTSFVPPLEPVAAATGLAVLAWSGIDIGLFGHHLKKGGVGLPVASAVFRKRRGSSQYSDEDPEVARAFEAVLARHGAEPGVSLDETTKGRLERFLGFELGEVRLHTGPLAREVTRATEAHAVTFGRDIYVPSEKLGSAEGLSLLAHEVTHVAQASPATPTRSPRALGAGSIERMEDVARSVEQRFARVDRAPAYRAEATVREAPPVAAAASVAAGPLVPATAAVQRRAVGDGQTPGFDPVREVMLGRVPSSISQEEFLEICTERLVELVKDELSSDAERRESLAWNGDLPSV